jgi:hypothetical protein
MMYNQREMHLQPQCCTLANRGELRRLKVCKTQRRQVTILARESGKAVDDDCELFQDEGQSGTHEDEVRIAFLSGKDQNKNR